MRSKHKFFNFFCDFAAKLRQYIRMEEKNHFVFKRKKIKVPNHVIYDIVLEGDMRF